MNLNLSQLIMQILTNFRNKFPQEINNHLGPALKYILY